MELPFKYMVLCIIKKLNERNMPLVINKVSLIDYFSEFIRKSDFTTDEKKEIVDNFDFDYELDDLCNKYYKYFDIDSEKIIFDEEYALDIDNLILEEKSEYDDVYIYDINFIIEGSTSFLDIIGVKIRKDLYNYLSDLERDIENCYNEMSDCYNYSISQEVSTDSIVSRIKKLMIIKTVMLLNTKNLLTKYEYCDLIGYANTVTANEDYRDDTTLLLKDEDFDMSDIMHDVFLRSIFMGSDSYAYNLRDRLIINMIELDNNIKFSVIKFYLTFLELLEKEIGTYNVVLDM